MGVRSQGESLTADSTADRLGSSTRQLRARAKQAARWIAVVLVGCFGLGEVFVGVGGDHPYHGVDLAIGIVLLWVALTKIRPRAARSRLRNRPGRYVLGGLLVLGGVALIVAQSLHTSRYVSTMIGDYAAGGALAWLGTRIWPRRHAIGTQRATPDGGQDPVQ